MILIYRLAELAYFLASALLGIIVYKIYDFYKGERRKDEKK